MKDAEREQESLQQHLFVAKEAELSADQHPSLCVD